MRIFPMTAIVAAAFLALGATPAAAGTVTVKDGQVSWQSTRCTVPTPPPSLQKNPETPANDINARVSDYNTFSRAVQAYNTCISGEAQTDANTVSQAVVAAAQSVIEDEHRTAASLGAQLQQKPTP